MRQLIVDDRGAMLSIELVLTATIVTLGSIVGLSSFRDTVVQEFGDVSAAASGLNHSYKITDISYNETIEYVDARFQILGSGYSDNLNFCEPRVPDTAGASPMCIEITADLVIQEGSRLP